ncbi:NAD(P)/FAD-dependent oxidoreductase [Paenibacillus sp. GCM10012303]|uniref:NAD(P)/FAD-dependent oxidoreductase n=1 Tax=Paenibacillus sp. GCM10012303 TaxID=3317340 RepID=UPI00361CFCDB
MNTSFDVIVVGARVAGASLAYELAKAGWKVLLLDKAQFPSDTLSTHNFLSNSLVMLREMGVLDRLLETNTPLYSRAVIQFDDTVIDGRFPEVDGEMQGLCIRRKHLDTLLQQHALAQNGVTLIDGFRVTDVIREGETVTGVKGASRSGQTASFHARLVVGADGRLSALRGLVNSPCLHSVPTDFASYVGYYEGYRQDGDIHVELYKIGDKMGIVFPTSDDRYVVGIMFPLNDAYWMDRFQSTPDTAMLEIAESGFAGSPLPGRLRKAQQSEKIKGLHGYNNDWFQGMGKGWALVGDALSFKDPVVGQGMPDALYGARTLTGILSRYRDWDDNWERMAADYQLQMEHTMMARFQMACQFTKNVPFTQEQHMVNRLIAASPEATRAFLGVYNRAVEPQELESILMGMLSGQ